MRSLQVLFAGGLLSTLTSALEASVYTFGASSKGVTGHKSPSVSPAGARLYFTERLGLSQYHNLADADEATLQLLSDERATQAPLFADHEEGKARALLIVEGVDDAEHSIFGTSKPVFTINEPPSQKLNKAFIDDLLAQSRMLQGSQGTVALDNIKGGVSSKEILSTAHEQLRELVLTRASSDNPGDVTVVIHLSDDKDGHYALFTDLHQFILEFERYIDFTVVLMPQSADNNKHSVGSWGDYKKLEARSIQKEAPLSEGARVSVDEAVASTFPMVPQAKNSSLPIKTTLKQCFSSEDACNKLTASCSGHGSCFKKFTEKVPNSDEERAECWSCGCKPTVVERGSGQQKIYWGGSACQKKDVTMQFWLIAGFSIALVSAITWGIGLMYSIGQEQLPSVLGAGVAGPTARK